MEIVATTPRLILRRFELRDAQTFYELNNTPDVIKYTGDLPFKSIADAFRFIKDYKAYQQTGMGRWAIELKKEKRTIGWCGLKKHPNGMIDLGYRILKEFWNKGYATEAAKASINYGFKNLNLKTIIGRTSSENKASIHVLEKIGMQFWKTGECEGFNNAFYYKIMQNQL